MYNNPRNLVLEFCRQTGAKVMNAYKSNMRMFKYISMVNLGFVTYKIINKTRIR